jgi:hypothetical protein
MTPQLQASLFLELPKYVARAALAPPGICPLKFFAQHAAYLPSWASLARKCVHVLTSSAGAERVFGLAANMFTDLQGGQLNDAAEASVMLRHNHRSRAPRKSHDDDMSEAPGSHAAAIIIPPSIHPAPLAAAAAAAAAAAIPAVLPVAVAAFVAAVPPPAAALHPAPAPPPANPVAGVLVGPPINVPPVVHPPVVQAAAGQPLAPPAPAPKKKQKKKKGVVEVLEAAPAENEMGAAPPRVGGKRKHAHVDYKENNINIIQ